MDSSPGRVSFIVAFVGGPPDFEVSISEGLWTKTLLRFGGMAGDVRPFCCDGKAGVGCRRILAGDELLC